MLKIKMIHFLGFKDKSEKYSSPPPKKKRLTGQNSNSQLPFWTENLNQLEL